MSGNSVVLSYNDTILRNSDIELLKGSFWLNDTIIAFYLDYLEVNQFRNHKTSLLFVSPQVTQCIKVSSNTDLPIFLDPLKARTKEFIFFALNDNEQTDVSGGTHWSLLVFSSSERTVFHFDSSKGSNREQAADFGEKILKYFDIPPYGRVIEQSSLQQTNGYDCGIHVLCNAEFLANYVIRYAKISGCGMPERALVQRKRADILNLVNMLRKK